MSCILTSCQALLIEHEIKIKEQVSFLFRFMSYDSSVLVLSFLINAFTCHYVREKDTVIRWHLKAL